MNTEKRLLAAFALSMVVLILWQALYVKEQPQHGAKPGSVPAVSVPKPGQPVPASKVVPSPPKAPPSVKLSVVEGSEPEELVVEGPLYRVTFSTEGAVIVNWVLTHYTDARGKLLDVVNGEACKQLGYPMQVVTDDPKLDAKLNHAVFVVKPAGTLLKAPVTVEMVYSDGQIEARKKFTFGSSYEIQSEVSVFDGQHYKAAAVTWPGGFGDHSLGEAVEDATSAAAYESGGKITAEPLSKLGPSFFSRFFSGGNSSTQQEKTKGGAVNGPFDFAGLEDRYFAGIFFTQGPDQDFRFSSEDWNPPDWKGKEPPAALTARFGEADPAALKFRLFVGPKSVGVLDATHPPLNGLLDWGWFGFIAKPLFLAMKYVYQHWVHNYGWAIIILTVLLNIAIFPLRLKSIRSAQEMQRVAPLVKAIQDRYKQYKFNDPRRQRMNQEMMKLYQEHHINPLGGCLPMALQLPLIYAFWRMLELPIELRHAPWILWFKDLSQPDTTHLFGLPIPILWTAMMISSFVMTKMTPMATADPKQKSMMLFMPLFFGFIFLKLASGLVLYYLTANVVAIATQVYINRKMAQPAPAAASKAQQAKA